MIVDEGVHTCDHQKVIAMCQSCNRTDCPGDCEDRKALSKKIAKDRKAEIAKEKRKKKRRKSKKRSVLDFKAGKSNDYKNADGN